MTPLPIDPVLPEIVAALRRAPALVLQAPTGAGKTTRVPPALLDAGLVNGRIVVLEPRRLAARAAARRMASERGGRLGALVGYQVRFDRNWGPKTRILVVTPGILLRMLQDDPFLETVGAILFDEFHERGLEGDLALGMVRRVQQTIRPELRTVVMSATLAAEPIARFLGDCPTIVSEGRLFPVEVRYLPRARDCPVAVAAARAVELLLAETAGDLLVFLPGVGEIRQTARHLAPVAGARGLAILPLYGDLPAQQQDAALVPQERRRIVLATNVAETSVTVEGITGVVDSGLARVLEFDLAVGLDRLKLVPIAKASAEQRAGRAGRTQPGICLRLWSEVAQRARPEQIEPEIRRVDLAGAILQLLCWGERDVLQFPWLEPPPAATVAQGHALLQRLGAIDDQGVTELGRVLARLPVQPRLGRLLVEGQRRGQPRRAALAAALLAERDPFTRPLERRAAERHASQSDLLDRVAALEEFERSGRSDESLGTLNRGAARFIFHARDQLARLADEGGQGRSEKRGGVAGTLPPLTPNPSPPSTGERGAESDADDAILRALLAAFPERLARRREAGGRRGVMVGGRGVCLAPYCGVTEPELFLCLDVDAGQAETLVRQASAVERGWLPADRLSVTTEVFFDPASARVAARCRTCYEDLVLEESPAALPADERVAALLADAAAADLDKVLPPADSPAGLFRTRVRCLRQWLPELQLPALDEAELRDVLTTLCHNCRSFAALRQAPWLEALQARLTHVQRQALAREAPERLEVPSGSRVTLQYEEGRPPLLAVRIQELFGLRDTPRVAAGRVRVLLHLLAPNFRPQQVTDDLASFWANTYPQVRKDLRARYPRHAWPEDPWSAAPAKGPRQR